MGVRIPISLSAAMLLSGITLALAQTEKPSDEIIVTGSPLQRAADELAIHGAITVLDRTEILRRGGATLGEVLGRQPGISESSFAAGASRPIIRGLDNFRVRMQENGFGSQGASALSEDHGVPIDPLAAQRIEIVRGPAVLRYGNEAIGGVVNVLNNRIPNQTQDAGASGEAYSAFSTVNHGYEGGGLVDGRHGSIALHGDGYYRDASDYEIPRAPGEQDNTFVTSWGASIGGSLLLENGRIGGALAQFESEYGIPAGDEPIFLDIEQTKITFAAALEALAGPISQVEITGGYSAYTHDEVALANGAVGSTFENDEFEARIEATHAPFVGFEGAVGAQFRSRDLFASGEGGELLAPNDTRAIGFFLFEEVSLSEDATLQMGARVDLIDVDGLGFLPIGSNGATFAAGRKFATSSGSVGMLWDLGAEITASLTGNRIERAPDALELFAKGPHEATETFEIGDPNLKTETALSVEASLKRLEGAVTFDIAGYYTAYKNFIFKAFTGLECGEDFSSCGSETELAQILYGQRDAEFYGVEAQAAWEVARFGAGVLGIEGRFDFVRGVFKSGGNAPRIPALRFGGGLTYESAAWNARIDLLRASKQNKTGAFETATKGYLRMDAELFYTFTFRDTKTNIDVGVTAQNILDEDARNHVSFKKVDMLLPGRNFRFVVRAAF